MFEGTLGQFDRNCEALLQALRITDAIRRAVVMQFKEGTAVFPGIEHLYTNAAIDLVRILKESQPNRVDWQVLDHCSGHTRLYALYERAFSDMIADYVAELPNCLEKYTDLPNPLLKAYRKGFGRILLDIDRKRYYRSLDENQIVQDLATGMLGGASFKLLPEAFLVDKQALRFERLTQILADLGITDAGEKLKSFDLLESHLSSGQETLTSLLDSFIDDRNDAAHGSNSGSVLSLHQFTQLAHFVKSLILAVANALHLSIIEIRNQRKTLPIVGVISEIFKNGYVVIVKGPGCQLVTGDTVVLQKGNKELMISSILEIQLDGASIEKVASKPEVEVGLRITTKAKVGQTLLLANPLSGQNMLPLNTSDEVLEELIDRESDQTEYGDGPSLNE